MAKRTGRGSDSYEQLEKFEKIRRKKQRLKHSDSKNELVFASDENDWNLEPEEFLARVVEVHKRYVFVSTEPVIGEIDTKDVWLAQISRKHLQSARNERNFVVVGDRVRCRPATEGESAGSEDLPECIVEQRGIRTTAVQRQDPLIEERQHVLAANVDQLIIVASYFSPRVKWGLIDRYLVLAENQNLPAVIVLNKYDLLLEEKKSRPDVFEEFERRAEYYKSLGYPVIKLQAYGESNNSSIHENQEKLHDILSGKVSLFSGHSGVGKSSICNLYNPEIEQDVEENPDIFYKGRHTTSYASFIRLLAGAFVIDSPGIRSFLIDRDLQTLNAGFIEIRELARQCHYRMCTHIQEPDCAVQKAVEDGELPEWRYGNYRGIFLDETGREGRIGHHRLDQELE